MVAVLGVLVVQNVTARNYTEEEIEALETVAMVLAELLAGGELLSPGEARHVDTPARLLPVRLPGVNLNGGLAMGTVVEHQRGIVIRPGRRRGFGTRAGAAGERA